LKLNENLSCTSQKLQCLVQKLKSSCSNGVDGIRKNHLLYAHTSVFTVCTWAIFFNLCLSHNHILIKCLESLITSIVKSSQYDPTNINNYRPIAVATTISNLFELFILSEIKVNISTCDNQFGFKTNHSTDSCVFLLIQNYF